MKTHLKQKCNPKRTNVKRQAYLKFLLASNGYKQIQIAKNLNITFQAVSNFIAGRGANARISEWFKTNLKIEV